MHRGWISWVLILTLAACARPLVPIPINPPDRTATPTATTQPIPRPTETAFSPPATVARPSPRPTPTAPPTPTHVLATTTPRPPAPTPTPTLWVPRALSPSPRPQPLPEGFWTEGNWIAVFRPELEHGAWSEGAVWLTDGQRWIGPWPPDLAVPFWTLWNERLHFCYWRSKEWFPTPEVPPMCVEAPSTLMVSRNRIGPYDQNPQLELRPCGRSGELCVEQKGERRSPPLQFPIPEPVLEPGYVSPGYVSIDECRSPDQRHALIAIPQIGGPLLEGDELFRKVNPDFNPPPLVFPGGLYWTDYQSRNVMTAPIHAPTWPDQQALARAMAEQGRFPTAFLPFLQRSLLGPTEVGMECAPDGRFALQTFRIWLPPEEVYLPADVRRYPNLFDSDFRPPQYANLLWVWVIRVEDGTGYPLTLLSELFNVELLIAGPERLARFEWVPFLRLPQDLPWVPLPPRPPEYPPPWEAP